MGSSKNQRLRKPSGPTLALPSLATLTAGEASRPNGALILGVLLGGRGTLSTMLPEGRGALSSAAVAESANPSATREAKAVEERNVIMGDPDEGCGRDRPEGLKGP